jgi:protein-tyrosine-phosphatase
MSYLIDQHDGGSWAAWARRFVKNAIAKRMIQEIARYRNYKPEERPLYVRLRVLNGLGLRKERSRKAPATAHSFLFVCSGNIMRGPMCEALMKRALVDFSRVDVLATSAGLNARPGKPAHPWSLIAAREFGIDLSEHRARPLTLDTLDQADAIFVMDYQNQVELLCRYPRAKEKVFMLSAYAGDDYRLIEIRDPFYGDEEETRYCYRILQTCINNLVATLVTNAKRKAVSMATESHGSD